MISTVRHYFPYLFLRPMLRPPCPDLYRHASSQIVVVVAVHQRGQLWTLLLISGGHKQERHPLYHF